MTRPEPPPVANDRTMMPPNPHFTRDYIWHLPMSGKQMVVKIPARGNAINPLDAADAVEMLRLIIKRLERNDRAVELEGEK